MAAMTTIAAVGGLASTAVSTGISFTQAAKQRKLMEQAERDADKAMAEARGKLEINYAEQMAIKKEAYDLEREAMLVQGAMATQAGVESERGAAATAGRIYAGQQAGQAQIRGAMADEMTNIEAAILEEESRLRDLGVGLDLEEVAGEQLKAAQAQEAMQLAKAQGIKGAINLVGQGISMVPLYSQNIKAQKAAVEGMQFNQDQFNKFGQVQDSQGILGEAGEGFTNLDFEKIGNMSNRQFRKFKKDLTPLQNQMIFKNQQYIQDYQNPFSVFLPNPAGTVTQ